jgi:thiol-disulfide isomerase/thioredoxin
MSVLALSVLLLGLPARAAAPEIKVVDLKGFEAALASYKGKAVLVNFWAIWCQPCVAELPDLLEVGRQFRDQPAAVVTVSYDLMVPDVTKEQVLKQVREFAAAKKIDAPVYIYDAPDYDAINARFGLPGPVPMTIALDRSGQVVERHPGRSGRDGFAAMLRKALGQ